MADRLNCVVQAGHVPRTRGATGANGLLGTEQQFTLKTATYIQKWLTLRGWTCEMIGADDDVPDSTVFVAIHHDGSRNASARGPSVGYPADYKDGSKNAAQEWKRVYGAAYPGPSFRPDNYTGGLRGYYAFRKSTARIKLCLRARLRDQRPGRRASCGPTQARTPRSMRSRLCWATGSAGTPAGCQPQGGTCTRP